MGSLLVVSPKPVSADLADVLEIVERVRVEHFIARAVVIALDVGVLIAIKIPWTVI